MKTRRSLRIFRRSGKAVFVVFLLALVFLATGFLSPDAQSVAEQATGAPAASGALDNLDFAGSFGPADGSGSSEDALHFRDGYFWSSICTVCSFMPGAYWTRRVGDAIEFQGVLESPDRGRFVYRGSVRDGLVRVAINWRRDRWYWSIDRDYVFEGRLRDNALPEVTLESARMQAAGEAMPDCPI